MSVDNVKWTNKNIQEQLNKNNIRTYTKPLS